MYLKLYPYLLLLLLFFLAGLHLIQVFFQGTDTWIEQLRLLQNLPLLQTPHHSAQTLTLIIQPGIEQKFGHQTWSLGRMMSHTRSAWSSSSMNSSTCISSNSEETQIQRLILCFADIKAHLTSFSALNDRFGVYSALHYLLLTSVSVLTFNLPVVIVQRFQVLIAVHRSARQAHIHGSEQADVSGQK